MYKNWSGARFPPLCRSSENFGSVIQLKAADLCTTVCYSHVFYVLVGLKLQLRTLRGDGAIKAAPHRHVYFILLLSNESPTCCLPSLLLIPSRFTSCTAVRHSISCSHWNLSVTLTAPLAALLTPKQKQCDQPFSHKTPMNGPLTWILNIYQRLL